MSARLGERLRGMLCSVGALFRAPYSGADAESRPVLRGNMRRAIVIKTPDDMFAEACSSCATIMIPASAAGNCCVRRRALPRDTRSARSRRAGIRDFRRWRCFVLGASAAVLTLWISGVL